MNGDTGTNAQGVSYNYYACYGHKQHRCRKKSIQKELIEDIVARDTLSLLTPEVIDYIANATLQEYYKEVKFKGKIPALEARLAELETALNNITAAIERGVVPDTLLARMIDLESEKKSCEKELAYEKQKKDALTKEDIVKFLSRIKSGDLKTPQAKK